MEHWHLDIIHMLEHYFVYTDLRWLCQVPGPHFPHLQDFNDPWGIFTFVTVFILWVLHSISIELENPFGADANDLDVHVTWRSAAIDF